MKHSDIDALARLLDGDLPEGEVSAEARALGAFAKALESTAGPVPAFAGKADLRASLIEAAREQAARPGVLARMRGSINDTTQRWRYSMRVAAATGASAMALSTGGVALAAQQALPGDALYGVKLALEDVGLLFIGDQAERGEQQLVDAGERMDEARTSAEAGDMGGAHRALRESDAAARSGARDIIQASQKRGDTALLAILVTFSEQQRTRLAALLPMLTGEAAAAGNDAMVGLNRIDQRVAVLGGTQAAGCGACDAESAQGGGGGKGSGGQDAQSTSTGASAQADARTFDFSDIPPASEPFAPCPCTADSEPAAGGDPRKPAAEATEEADEAATEKPRKPREPKPTDAPEPPKDDEEIRPTLPPELEEPVDEVEEPVDEVIDEVIDELPTQPPSVPPTQSSTGGLRTPNPRPSIGLPLP